jgi:hypothetical protein
MQKQHYKHPKEPTFSLSQSLTPKRLPVHDDNNSFAHADMYINEIIIYCVVFCVLLLLFNHLPYVKSFINCYLPCQV